MSGKRLLIALMSAVTVAVLVWFAQPKPRGQKATIGESARPPQEKVFASPVPISWEGEVIGVMESGQVLAIRRIDGTESFLAVLLEPLASVPKGLVRVRGEWIGITCAYQHTVFDGRCVPEVRGEVDIIQ
jgi:hypothetical protein